MTRNLLAAVAVIAIMSGGAFAQTVPYGTSTTTTVAPTPDGGYHASTEHKRIDGNGDKTVVKHTYKNGIEGGTETHSRTQTDPYGGESTTQTTTTMPH